MTTTGGYVGGGALIALPDDECVLNRDVICIREDDRHHHDFTAVYTFQSRQPVAWSMGRCHHRPCHVVPVESVIDGKVLAHLCRACDTQLP